VQRALDASQEALVQQRQTHPGGGEGGGGVVAAGHDKRLGEIEHALLAERQYRKQLEDQLIEVREQSPLTALDAVDGAVSEALERSGTAGAVSHLDEKVKECGRLIVRMGTELMEETKRRQALEAEVQELRMRLSGVEAVARSPVGGASLPTYPPAGMGMPDFGGGSYGGVGGLGGGFGNDFHSSSVDAADALLSGGSRRSNLVR